MRSEESQIAQSSEHVDASIRCYTVSQAARQTQREVETSRLTVGPYELRWPDMMVLAATINKQSATRNLMIPLLARNMKNLKKDEGLYDAFLKTTDDVRKVEAAQVQYCQSTMRSKLCLKNIFSPEHAYQSSIGPPTRPTRKTTTQQRSCSIS